MKFFALLSLGAVRTLVDAWAVLVLWRWFVLPLGAPAISYWHAAGLDLFVGMFFMFAASKPSETDDEAFGWAAGKLSVAPIVVGLGWLLHLGMA